MLDKTSLLNVSYAQKDKWNNNKAYYSLKFSTNFSLICFCYRQAFIHKLISTLFEDTLPEIE